MRQFPISKWTNPPLINLFAGRVCDSSGNAPQSQHAGNPSHRQPRPFKMSIQIVTAHSPEHRQCNSNDCRHTDCMNHSCRHITLVDVASNSMCLIFENYPDRILCFAEVLAWVHAHKSTGRAVLLTRVGGFFCTLRIYGRVLTEVAFYGDQIGSRANRPLLL